LVNTVVKSTYEFVQGINKEATHYTEEELSGLLDSADDLDKWMIEKIAAQKALLDTQEPAIITSQVLEKTNKVKDQLVKLMAKKKPKVPKKKKEEKKEEKTEDKSEDKSEKPEETKEDVKEESEKPDHDHDEL
jgi:hypoxia up-regulated 1